MRGNELQRRFESVETQAQSDYTLAQNELRTASGTVDRLVNEQVKTVLTIANVVLEEEGRKGLIVGAGARRASQRLQAELEQRETQRRQIKSRLTEQRSAVAALELEVKTAEHALHTKELDLEALQRQAIQKLKEDPRIASQFDRLEVLADQLDKSEEKARKSQEDADKKAPAFENNPLFAYLLKRKFGTDQYVGNNFVAALDGWVARKVQFARYFPDYQRLKMIPKMIRDHTSQLRSDYEETRQSVESGRANALRNWPGIREADKEIQQAHSALERVKARHHEALSNMENLDDALTQFAQGRDPHTKRALDMITQLINSDSKEGEALVRATTSTEDDRALEHLHKLRKDLAAAREHVEELKQRQVQARTQFDRTQDFMRRFRESSLGRSNKRYSDTKPETWIAALAAGAALDQLFSQVKSNARTVDDTPTYSSSSPDWSGGFGSSSSSSSRSDDSGWNTSSGFGGGGYETTGSIGGGDYKTTDSF